MQRILPMTPFKTLLRSCLLFIPLGLAAFAQGLEFPLPPPGTDIVGSIQTVIAGKNDTLSGIGMRYDIGYAEMAASNPEASVTGRLKPGMTIVVPSRFILPSIRTGLVVNLAELRVYWFPSDAQVVYTFPVGAGREGWNTPIAATKVIDKKANPIWVVPDSILAESRRLGKPLKKYYKPGPNNPLGKYALYFALPGIRMHGTNMPASVGRRASHGCIRMLPNDIKFLYEHVPLGTPVHIIHEQNKVGWDGPILYLEAEVPFNEYDDVDSGPQAIAKATKNHPAIIDEQRVKEALQNQDGLPLAIGHDASVASLPADQPIGDADGEGTTDDEPDAGDNNAQ